MPDYDDDSSDYGGVDDYQVDPQVVNDMGLSYQGRDDNGNRIWTDDQGHEFTAVQLQSRDDDNPYGDDGGSGSPQGGGDDNPYNYGNENFNAFNNPFGPQNVTQSSVVTNTNPALGLGTNTLYNDIPQTAAPQNFSKQSIAQQVLNNVRTQQAIAAGQQVVLVRNNTINGVPVSQSTVLSPGSNGVYQVGFDGALNSNGSLIPDEPVTYTFPAVPGTNGTSITVPASPSGSGSGGSGGVGGAGGSGGSGGPGGTGGSGGSGGSDNGPSGSDSSPSVVDTSKVTDTSVVTRIPETIARLPLIPVKKIPVLQARPQKIKQQKIPQNPVTDTSTVLNSARNNKIGFTPIGTQQTPSKIPVYDKDYVSPDDPDFELITNTFDLLKDVAGKANKKIGNVNTANDASKVAADLKKMRDAKKDKNIDKYYDSKNKLIQDTASLIAGLVAADVIIVLEAMKFLQDIMENNLDYLREYLNELRELRNNPNISPDQDFKLYQEEGRIYQKILKLLGIKPNAADSIPVIRQAKRHSN